MILGEVAWLLGAGLVAGVALALAGGRLAGALLFGLAPWDPPTFVATALLTAAIAVLACLPAVRRAGSVDPLAVLREE
jgi:ABC-type antimicrobial peptide transport system permease subunit